MWNNYVGYAIQLAIHCSPELILRPHCFSGWWGAAVSLSGTRAQCPAGLLQLHRKHITAESSWIIRCSLAIRCCPYPPYRRRTLPRTGCPLRGRNHARHLLPHLILRIKKKKNVILTFIFRFGNYGSIFCFKPRSLNPTCLTPVELENQASEANDDTSNPVQNVG